MYYDDDSTSTVDATTCNSKYSTGTAWNAASGYTGMDVMSTLCSDDYEDPSDWPNCECANNYYDNGATCVACPTGSISSAGLIEHYALCPNPKPQPRPFALTLT